MEYSEALFKTIKQMPCLYALKDLNHRYQYLSDELAVMFGYQDAEAARGISGGEFKCGGIDVVYQLEKQDQIARKKGKSRCIHIYEWSGGNKKILLDCKKPYFDEHNICIGNSVHAVDLLETASVFEGLVQLFEVDKGYVHIKQHTGISYHLLDHYPKLSRRESQCLFYLLRGKNIKSIANMMSISVRTVEQFIDKIKCKFQCRSRAQIIDYANEHDLLAVILTSMLEKINATLYLE